MKTKLPVQFILCDEEKIKEMKSKNEIFRVEEEENETKIFVDPDRIYFEVETAKGNTVKMDGKNLESIYLEK